MRWPQTWMALSATFVMVENAKAELPDLAGGYLCTGQCGAVGTCLKIQQNGAELSVSGEDGYRTSGRLLGNSTIQVGDRVDTQKRFVDGTILLDPMRVEWGNDTAWIRTGLCPNP